MTSQSGDDGQIPTAIEQFDLQSAGSLMWGFDEGWHEAEYNPRVGLWRWTSERASFRIIDATTAVRVRIQIESPSRYFDGAPTAKITAAGQIFAEVRPTGDAIIDAVVPAAALQAANGRVTVETSRVFVPAERSGASDRRHLGLRVFGVSVTVPNLRRSNLDLYPAAQLPGWYFRGKQEIANDRVESDGRTSCTCARDERRDRGLLEKDAGDSPTAAGNYCTGCAAAPPPPPPPAPAPPPPRPRRR